MSGCLRKRASACGTARCAALPSCCPQYFDLRPGIVQPEEKLETGVHPSRTRVWGPEVCTCRRLQKRTAARRYQFMHLGVRSSPVPGGVHLQKAAKKTNRGKFMHLLHLSPEVCTCRSRTAAAGISACISGSVRHLPPEVCTCRRLQIPSTAARGSSTCISGPVLHLSPEVCTCRRQQIPSTAARGLSTCISGSVLHLSPEVCAKTNSSTRAFTRVVHCWGTLCGRCALAGTANARTLQRPHSLRVCRWGKHQKREMQRLSRAGVLELVIIVSCFGQ